MGLAQGPMLHAPSSTGFSVWCRGDASDLTYTLEVRKAGDTAWTVADTATTDGTKSDTVVLEATGLLSGTEYEYQVKDTGAVVPTGGGTLSTFTMPASGRFVAYHISDPHDANAETAYDAALSDWETNYEPSGIPAVIVQTGDLWTLDNLSDDTIANAMTNSVDPIMQAIAYDTIAPVAYKALARIPIMYMFDDWDWAGNNSSRIFGTRASDAFQGGGDVLTNAKGFYRTIWRGQPAPLDSEDADTSFAWSATIAGVPFIFTDQRSQRTQTSNTPADDGATGAEVFVENGNGTTPTVFGYAQREWLIDQLRSNNEKGLVMLISGGTFRSHVAQGTSGPAARDSIGWFFKGERNYVMREGAIKAGYNNQRRLVVLSGDDHWNNVWQGELGDEKAFNDADGWPTGNLGLPFIEVKTACNALTNGIKVDVTGPGTHFHNEVDKCIGRWDITSTNAGKNVQARLTIMKTADGSTAVSENSTGNGNPNIVGNDGDFYWDNGVFVAYDTAGPEVTQVYPPENGATGVTFNRWYEDDITGHMVPEDRVARDWYDRLRDVGDLDEPDRDELLDSYTWPEEDDPEEP